MIHAVKFTSQMVLLVVLLVRSGIAQDSQPAPDQERARKLGQARTIITDVNASPQVRQIGAEDLLELGSAEAIDLAIDLLGATGSAGPRIAVCEAVAALGARRPGLLNERLVPPLMNLLGSAAEPERAAAAMALSSFAEGAVARKLGELAAEPKTPLVQRMAAVRALAPNVDQRTVVAQLIRLLDSESEEIRAGALAALKPASRLNHGSDIARWKRWWEQKVALDQTQWLQDRVRLLRQQSRRLREEMIRRQGRLQQHNEVLARRLADQLSSVFRLTPQPQQQDLLLAWLSDPLVEYRTVAVSIIAAAISDGNRPSDALREALRERFADESPQLRVRVLEVVAALTDPDDAEAVRGRLDYESDPAVRQAILRTLGHLQDADAVEPLVAELANPQATPDTLVAAAVSLGLLAAQGNVDEQLLPGAIGPLKQLYSTTAPEAVRLRAALLGAMASLGVPQFTEEFLANLDADEPDLLLPALEGVRRIADASRLDRVLALTGANDARVRRRAIGALAVLGGDSVHLEALAQRIDPAIEPNDTVREAAWNGFRAILAKEAPGVRLQWAPRLKHLPERQEAYLLDLVTTLSQQRALPTEMADARRGLAELYDAQGRQAESVSVWRDLWSARASLPGMGEAEVREVGLAYLSAMLESGRYDDLAALIAELLSGESSQDGHAVEAALLTHLRFLAKGDDPARLELYRGVLERLEPGTFGAEFTRQVRNARGGSPQIPADDGTTQGQG